MNHTSFVNYIFNNLIISHHLYTGWNSESYTFFCNLHLQSLFAMCMRLEDDQNKLSVFNHDGFIIENIFCFANHPATRAHFIISFIRNWYNQNAVSFSIKHIMKKYIIWFMYVYLENRRPKSYDNGSSTSNHIVHTSRASSFDKTTEIPLKY